MTTTANPSITLTQPLLAPAMRLLLEPERRRLVDLMQQVNFGRVFDLHVRAELPSFDPLPRIERDVKLDGGENGTTKQARLRDFTLKAQVVRLFEELLEMGDGVVLEIEVRHGLPARVRLPGRIAG